MIDTTDTTALILSGQGYELTIAPEAEQRKTALLAAAAAVTKVTDNDLSADAQVHSRRLAQMRIEVEKCRKAVKEPVNRIGKLIDQTAKDFLVEIEAEEKRIGRLVGDHATEQARLKAEKEREERRAFEEARAAREAAERAAAAAEEASTNKLSIAEVIAAKKAEQAAETERQAALAARMDASAAVASTKIADGVRFAWDFEVNDIHALYATDTGLVEVTPRRAVILQKLKEMAETMSDDNVSDVMLQVGIRAFKKPVVSSR